MQAADTLAEKQNKTNKQTVIYVLWQHSRRVTYIYKWAAKLPSY